MPIDATSALVRALSFIAMFQASGAAMVSAVFGARLQRSAPGIRKLGVVSATGGLALVAAHYALEAGRMAGSLSGVFDMELQQLVFDSPMRSAAGWRLAGLSMIACFLWREGRAATAASLAGALCVAIAFTFVGHTAEESRAGWLAFALTLHLLVVAFWFGSLVPLIVISRVESGQLASQVVAAFTRIASVLVPGLFVFGLALTLALVDRWTVFRESYGLLLLGKVLGFALLMALAALNKWRYGPAIARTPAAAVSFQRAVAAEYVLICSVLLVTAVMTMFFSPGQ
jgi:putative copper resistance protein D